MVNSDREDPEIGREKLAGLLEAVGERQDRDAFIALFDHFAPRLKTYLVGRGCAESVAEELCQEVMLTIWNKAATFDRRRSAASTWLYRIARNRHIDYLRRTSNRDFDPADPALQPEEPERPDHAAAARASEDSLREAIAGLPGEQAELLRLAFFDGQSHRQIAESLGLPLGTVKSRLRLAFGRLRRALESRR